MTAMNNTEGKPLEGVARPGEAKKARADGGGVAAIIETRRRRLWRTLLMSIVLGAILVALSFGFREFIGRNEYKRTMGELGTQVAQYKAAHGHLPSYGEVMQFKLQGRGPRLEMIVYEDNYITEGAPGDTPLAYTPLRKQYFLRSGHAVLQLDGQVRWLTDEDLQRKLTERNRRYNAEALHKTPK
jgi:hypothetical protein